MVEFDENWASNCWDPAQEPLPDTPNRHRKVSLCTACMGRLHDLMVTLPVNIHHNRDYPHIEFVVLNYNSPDKMDEWMRDYMMPYIEAGVLIYIHTTEPKLYSMAHSRNVAFKMATGEIVVNVDADNLTGRGFAAMLNSLAEVRPTKAVFSVRELFGQVGLYRNEWLELGGYDEQLEGYGYEDLNLVFRAMAAGCKLMAWDRWCSQFYERLPTTDADRVRHMECKHRVLTWFVNKRITENNLRRRQLVANECRPWGKATLVKNFRETVEI